jgi:hypothetical protein
MLMQWRRARLGGLLVRVGVLSARSVERRNRRSRRGTAALTMES